MAVTYTPFIPNFGFDGSVAPNWQMVPVGQTRMLWVSGASGLIPRVRNGSALAASLTANAVPVFSNTLLTLTGVRAGRAWVEWVPSASFSGPMPNDMILEVSVKAPKVLSTAFFYVTDGRQQITARRIGDLDALLARTNFILGSQSNLTLGRRSAATLRIAQNLRQVVRFSSHLQGAPDFVRPRQHEWDIVTGHKDASADFNVFFVKEYEQDNTPLEDNTAAGTIASEKACIFEDEMATPDHETLGHETMHLLGMPDHDPDATHLLTDAVPSGTTITRDQANIMNTTGT